MTMQQKIEQFKAALKKMKAYQHAMGVMFYDFETVMPKGAAEDFAAHMGILSEEVYKMQTAPEFKALIDELYEKKDGLDLVTRREVEVLREDSARTACIPMEEYVDYQKVQSMASSVWHEAKVNNDYAAFKPYLKQLVDYNRKFALYYAPDKDPYDTMLDQFEKGLTRKELDGFFGNLREKLLPLINETSARRDEIDDSFLFRHYPVEQQRAFSDYLMQVMGIDRNFCTIGEVEHPFTTNFTKHDVRITTHYYEDAVASSLYSVVHEGGHALYELHTGDELNDSPLGTGTSMGIHESQSRLFENIIGRSEEFTRLIFPKMEELFPEQLKGVTAWDFYRAVNKSVPSLIRTEADADDLTDELIDRFGDPPGAVNALIHVALLRGEAGRAGISDLSQKGNMLYFKVENFDMETLSALYAQKEFKNRVKLEAGREPRLGLKLRPGARPIPEARALVEAWNKLQKPAAEPAAEKE